MKDSRPSLVLFLIAGVMTVVSRIFEMDFLTLIFKPVVVPAIFYYYLQTKTRRVNVWFSIALWLFFAADMIMVIFPDFDVVNVMLCNLISYGILAAFASADSESVSFTWFNSLFMGLLMGLLCYILYMILSLNEDSIVNNYFIYLAYGIVLTLLVAVSTYNFLAQSTQSLMFLCLMALCFVISDLFYAINMFMFGTKLPVVDHINLIVQIVGYYFMVKYFTARRRKRIGMISDER